MLHHVVLVFVMSTATAGHIILTTDAFQFWISHTPHLPNRSLIIGVLLTAAVFETFACLFSVIGLSCKHRLLIPAALLSCCCQACLITSVNTIAHDPSVDIETWLNAIGSSGVVCVLWQWKRIVRWIRSLQRGRSLTKCTAPPQMDCAICLGTHESKKWCELVCRHKFHDDCIRQWWASQVFNYPENSPSCPICRQTYV